MEQRHPAFDPILYYFNIPVIMARFILVIVLILVLCYAFLLLIRGMPFRRKRMRGEPDAEELIQDPHCRIYIPKKTAVKGRGAGKGFYFCSQECLEGFLKSRGS